MGLAADREVVPTVSAAAICHAAAAEIAMHSAEARAVIADQVLVEAAAEDRRACGPLAVEAAGAVAVEAAVEGEDNSRFCWINQGAQDEAENK